MNYVTGWCKIQTFMSDYSESGGKLVRPDLNSGLTAGSYEAFAATLESIRDLAQKLTKSKELREDLWKKLFSFFDADSVADRNRVLN